MGARVARMFRNFNLENRVHRELSRDKPRSAPKYPDTAPPAAGASEAQESMNEKSGPLLDHLRSLYVESTDPEQPQQSSRHEEGAEAARRPLLYSVPGDQLGLVELTDVPKGKLTLAEALKALNSHQLQPNTWTAEKIAQEYSLELTDCKALLHNFCPFRVHIIPPASTQTKRIKDS